MGKAYHQKNVEKTLKQPVNCATAEGDLRILKSEKSNVAERMAEGVTAIAPAGIVIGVVTDTEKNIAWQRSRSVV